MMEFKFRVWDIEQNKMHSPSPVINYRIFIDMSGKIYYSGAVEKIESIQICLANPYTQDNLIVMPFTGFEDHMENEIFDGDILRLDPGYNQQNIHAQVTWDENCGCWNVINTEVSFYESLEVCFHESLADTLGDFCCYVIGNIYENPELLTEK